MKKIILSLCFLLASTLTYSQYEEWSSPIPFTDSVSDNKNPILVPILGEAYVFWEKSMDENATAIYMRNVTEMEASVALFGQDNAHYRNPQYISFYEYPNAPDTLFYLFFESDFEATGVFNLYYSKYSQDGSFSDPISINFNYTGCEHTRISDRNIVYASNGLIETIRLMGYDDNYYFSDIVLIDEGNVQNPTIGQTHIIYEKEMDNQQHLFISKYENEAWTTAEELYSVGDNKTSTIISENHYYGGDYAIIWESFQEEQWQIHGYNIWNDELEALEITNSQALSPHAIFFDIPIGQTESSLWLSYLTFKNSDEGNGDIFVNESYGSFTYPVNISKSAAADNHPKLFSYSFSFNHNIILCWESTRNDHQQLFITSSHFWVNTQELENEQDFSISPNPITQKAQISFSLAQSTEVSIEFITLDGKPVERLLQKNLKAGEHSLYFKPSKELKNGLYFVILKSKAGTSIKKLILQR